MPKGAKSPKIYSIVQLPSTLNTGLSCARIAGEDELEKKLESLGDAVKSALVFAGEPLSVRRKLVIGEVAKRTRKAKTPAAPPPA